MIKSRTNLFSTLVVTLVLSGGVVSAEESKLTKPEIHADIAIQMEVYSEGDSIIYLGTVKSAQNAYVLRHATIEVEGMLSDHIEYNMEIGTATCQGTLMGFQIMEAGIFYKPYDFMKVGFMKGHIMRGFTLMEGCIELVPSEKPRFAKIMCPCHPMGAVVETDYSFDETTGITAQFAYLNGDGNNSIDDEHDINFGLIFHTPLPGLSVSGYYNDRSWEAFDDNEVDVKSYEGYRTGFGFNYDAHNAHLRSEYYHGRGFDGGPVDSVKMDALLAEVAYTFNFKQKKLPYIQPYIAYEWWDMFSNASSEVQEGVGNREQEQETSTDNDYVCSVIAFGVSMGLGSSDAKLRIEYKVPLAFADSKYGHALVEDDEASRLLVRLQIGI